MSPLDYQLPPALSKVTAIRRIYPDLYRREMHGVRRGGNIDQGPDRFVSWRHLRRMAQVRWIRQHPAMRRATEIRYLDAHPTPEGNRRLAELMFPNTFWAFDRIIAGGDGIGRAPGESDWRHNVWNGGRLGGDSPGPSAQTCGGGAYAFGLGQACPRSKMADWMQARLREVLRACGRRPRCPAARHYRDAERIYDSPKRQLEWMVAYATGRYGSMTAAGNHWSITRSW